VKLKFIVTIAIVIITICITKVITIISIVVFVLLEKKVLFTNVALLLCISAELVSYPGYIPCPGFGSRQWVDVRDLCDGWNDCRDNSDEDPANCEDKFGQLHHIL